MNVFRMAWRNVWRNHRRSGITIAAMAFALVVELLYSGLMTGMTAGMEEDATEFDLGDIQIFAKGYLTRPSLYEAVEDHEAILTKLEAMGYPATARLFSGGLAASGEFSAGVGFVGLDPVSDSRVLSLYKAIAEGAWLDDKEPKGVVVGRGLARTLGLELGSEVVVLSQGADGSMANDVFKVRGVLMSIAAGMDRSTILMTEQTFRELFVFPTGAHKIIVRRPRDVPLRDAKAAVEATLGVGEPSNAATAPALDVMTWSEISPFLAQMMATASTAIVVVYFIVYVAVAILILNAMLMAVFERIREFGILKAIGYGPFRVLVMMVSEGMLQAAVALVIGLVIAAPGMWYLTTYGINVGVLGGVNMGGLTMPAVWMAEYTVGTAIVPVIMLFVIVFIAVIYPAVKAAWISPVEAMHHQ